MSSALSTIVTGRVWSTVVGGRRSEGLYQLVVDGDGSIYGVGYTNGHLEGEQSTANDGSQCDPLLVKFQPDGRLAWARILSTAFWGEAFGLALDGSGGVVVTGNGHVLEGQPPGAVVSPEQRRQLSGATSQGDPPPVGFVMQVDGQGRQLWTHALPNGIDQGTGVTRLSSGDFLVGTSAGASTYDSTGNLLWSQPLQGERVLATAALPNNQSLVLHSDSQGQRLTVTLLSAAGQRLTSSTPLAPAGRISGYSGASLVIDPSSTTAYAAVGIRTSSTSNQEELAVLRCRLNSLELERLHTIGGNGSATRPSASLAPNGDLLVAFHTSDPSYGSSYGGLGLWSWSTAGGEPRQQPLGSTSWSGAISLTPQGALLLADELTPVADWNDTANYQGSNIRLQALTLPGVTAVGPGTSPAPRRAGLNRSTTSWANDDAWAALRADGTVVARGPETYGALPLSLAQAQGEGRIQAITSNSQAFAFLQRDGKVQAWGLASAGGQLPLAVNLEGLQIQRVYGSATAFAALSSRGSVVCWGDAKAGGAPGAAMALLDGSVPVVEIVACRNGFAALRLDGSIVSWGAGGGGLVRRSPDSGSQAASPVESLFSTEVEMAALLQDGSVLVWPPNRPDLALVQPGLEGRTAASQAQRLEANGSSWAASTRDGALLTWPASNGPANERPAASVVLAAGSNVQELVGNGSAWAALLGDGSVRSWGANSAGGSMDTVVSAALQGAPGLKATRVVASTTAFAALRQNGSVISWGYGALGGDSSAVASQLDGKVPVRELVGVEGGFAALRQDGSVIRWNRSGEPAQGPGGLPVVELLNLAGGGQTFARHSDGSITPLSGWADPSRLALLNQPGQPVRRFADPFNSGALVPAQPPHLSGQARLVTVESDSDGNAIVQLQTPALPGDNNGQPPRSWLLSDYSADARLGSWWLQGSDNQWQAIPNLGQELGIGVQATSTLRFTPGPAFEGVAPQLNLRAVDGNAPSLQQRQAGQPLAGPAVVELLAEGEGGNGNGGFNLLLQGYDGNGQRLFGPVAVNQGGLRAINFGNTGTGLMSRLADGGTAVAWCGYNPNNSLAGDYADFFLTVLNSSGNIVSNKRLIDNDYAAFLTRSNGTLSLVDALTARPDGSLVVAIKTIGAEQLTSGRWRFTGGLSLQLINSQGEHLQPAIPSHQSEMISTQASNELGNFKSRLLSFADGSWIILRTDATTSEQRNDNAGNAYSISRNSGLISATPYRADGTPAPTITFTAYNQGGIVNNIPQSVTPEFGACSLSGGSWAMAYPISSDRVQVELIDSTGRRILNQELPRQFGNNALKLAGLVATPAGGLALPTEGDEILVLDTQARPVGLRSFSPSALTTGASYSRGLALTALASGELISAHTTIAFQGQQRSGERQLTASDGIGNPRSLQQQMVLPAMAPLAEYSQVAGNWDPALSPSTIPMAPVVPLVQANLEGALSNAVALALEGLEGESRWAPFPPTPVASGLQLSGDALGPQDDRLEGSASPDLLQGLLGRDTLQGGPGDDLLEGGPGADELWGGSGNDTLRGGVGDDRLRGEGGDGDQVQLAGPLNEYRVTLDPARGVLTLADQVPLRDGTDQITGVELFRFQDRRLNAAELMAIGLKQQSAPGTPAPLDLDGNGAYDLIDNRLLLQAGLGTFPAGTFSPPLGVTSEERASKEASVRQRFQQGQTMVNTAQGLRAPLDLDGDGRVEIFRDGLMLLRHRNGLGLSAISADLLATDALRDADQILAHLISLTPL